MRVNPDDIPVIVIATLLTARRFTIVSIIGLRSVIFLDDNDRTSAIVFVFTAPTVINSITFPLVGNANPVITVKLG
jgi:hypothetical protein|tara:strand:+ start:606 stop:833 length:228 start_codon:yes stop_codon:yes gene_type:complete